MHSLVVTLVKIYNEKEKVEQEKNIRCEKFEEKRHIRTQNGVKSSGRVLAQHLRGPGFDP